ncbi:MAG: DNA repair protein RecN [Deltaproteobacteria bacterium]|nr:DNA repair protein RecN [Deltaproteobacteria bacterium]
MLVALRIRQFVLIEELELRLEPGFNVLTGETGAGKSILVDALALVFGGRVTGDLVRPGADEAEVEALFDVASSAPVLARLAASGVETDGELVIRRVVHRSGRSRAYVNGRMCSARELLELTHELADVTSQHESVALVDPKTHLDYLDRHAGLGDERSFDALCEELALAVRAVLDLDEQLATLRCRDRERGEREGFLRYQLDAIDAVDPEPDEHARLSDELGRLKHGERLRSTAMRVIALLDGEDGGVCDELGRLAGELATAASLDARLHGSAEELDRAWTQLTDVSRELGDYLDRLDLDPTRLEEVQGRLYALEKLARAHGPSLPDVLATRDRLRGELEAFEAADARLPELVSAREGALSRAAVVARRVSRLRREAATRLAAAITRELADLGMAAATVVVDVGTRPAKEGEPQVDGARLAPTGIDRVELLLAPNPGGEPRPLGQIASGGELSRVLLALRRAVAAGGKAERRAGIVVLDEVDAGVGGETAERIGRAIASIATERQVLCITHLASIAAHADAHFVVEKRVHDGTTTSTAVAVAGAARVAELARMLTGARNGSTERAAKDLLTAARRSRTRSPKAA